MSQLFVHPTSHKLLYDPISHKLAKCDGGGTKYRQAKRCGSIEPSDVVMTATDAADFPNAFKVLGKGCFWFDFLEAVLDKVPADAILYAASSASASLSCDACEGGGNTEPCADYCCPNITFLAAYQSGIDGEVAPTKDATYLYLPLGPAVFFTEVVGACGGFTRDSGDHRWRATVPIGDTWSYNVVGANGSFECPPTDAEGYTVESVSGSGLVSVDPITAVFCCDSSDPASFYPFLTSTPSTILLSGTEDMLFGDDSMTSATPAYPVWDGTMVKQTSGPYVGSWLPNFPISMETGAGRYIDISGPSGDGYVIFLNPNGGLFFTLPMGSFSYGLRGCQPNWYGVLDFDSVSYSSSSGLSRAPRLLSIGPP